MLHIDAHNRPLANVTIAGQQARFWLNTGGDSLLLSERLARALDLDLSATPIEHDDYTLIPSWIPHEAFVDETLLDLSGVEAMVVRGASFIDGVQADAMLPGSILKAYHLILDYPQRQVIFGAPGGIGPQGDPVHAAIHPETGLPRIELPLLGDEVGMVLDTGASYTMLSRMLVEAGIEEHGWPHIEGAVGAANMRGSQMEVNALMTCIPEMGFGALRLGKVGAVSRPVGTFEEWRSQLTTDPVVGAVGGNLLRAFRLEIDYLGETIYIQKAASLLPLAERAIVPITLNSRTLTVNGVAHRGGERLVHGIHRGDELLAVDGYAVGGRPFADVVDLLRGAPGEKRSLTLQRGRLRLDVTAPVAAVLSA